MTEGSPKAPPTRLSAVGRLGLLSPRRRRLAAREVQAGDDARGRDWPAAARHYAAGLRIDPRLAHIWVQFGHALKESNDLVGAERAYRAALAYAPQVADTYLNLGHALKLQGRKQEAAAAYMRALELDGGWAEATRELSGLVRDGETLDLGALAAALESAPEARAPLVLHLSGLVRQMIAGGLDAAGKGRAALVLDLLAAAPDVALCEISHRAAGLRLLPNALLTDALTLALVEHPDPDRVADLRRLLDLASGAGAPCVVADGAVLVDLGGEGVNEDYRLQVRAIGATTRIYPLTFLASPDLSPEPDTAVLVETAHERRRLRRTVAAAGSRTEPPPLHVLEEQPGASRAERLLSLASQLSAQTPVAPAAAQAAFDAYYGLGREPDGAGDRLGLGAPFRDGSGWWAPEPWGSWTRPGGATLRIAVADADEPVRLLIGLKAPLSQGCGYRLQAYGETIAAGSLPAGATAWRAIEAQPRLGVLQIDIVGDGDHRLEPGARSASIGVIGFTLRRRLEQRAA